MAVGPTIYTAIVGCGIATQIFHVPLLLAHKQLFTLTTIVEKAGPKLVDAVNKANRTHIKWVSDIQSVIEDEDIELVSTPPCHFLALLGVERCMRIGCNRDTELHAFWDGQGELGVFALPWEQFANFSPAGLPRSWEAWYEFEPQLRRGDT